MIFCFYSNMKAWLQILRTVPNSSIFFPNLGTHHNQKAVFVRIWEFFFIYLPQCSLLSNYYDRAFSPTTLYLKSWIHTLVLSSQHFKFSIDIFHFADLTTWQVSLFFQLKSVVYHRPVDLVVQSTSSEGGAVIAFLHCVYNVSKCEVFR